MSVEHRVRGDKVYLYFQAGRGNKLYLGSLSDQSEAKLDNVRHALDSLLERASDYVEPLHELLSFLPEDERRKYLRKVEERLRTQAREETSLQKIKGLVKSRHSEDLKSLESLASPQQSKLIREIRKEHAKAIEFRKRESSTDAHIYKEKLAQIAKDLKRLYNGLNGEIHKLTEKEDQLLEKLVALRERGKPDEIRETLKTIRAVRDIEKNLVVQAISLETELYFYEQTGDLPGLPSPNEGQLDNAVLPEPSKLGERRNRAVLPNN